MTRMIEGKRMERKKRKNFKHFGIYIGLTCILAFLLVACGTDRSEDEQTKLSVFYISKDYTTTVEVDYFTHTKPTETDTLLNELFVQLSLVSSDLNLNMPLNTLVQINQYYLANGQLQIDFADSYYQLQPLDEVLVRAAIVQTVVGLEGVESVFFTVNGNAILNSGEQVIGRMDANTFINSTGSQINTYEKTKVSIYFANEEGTMLLPVERTLVYSSNISKERLIVEQIIDGPANEDSFATVNPDTMVNSVRTQDGVCYVDLSKEFLTPLDQVSAETSIYSLVNSLIELSTTTKVQISIDGNTEGMYLGEISLDEVFVRNLEIIER